MFRRIERGAMFAESAYRVSRDQGSSRLHAFAVAFAIGRAMLGR